MPACSATAGPTRSTRINPRGGVWTFWDYQAGAWQRDHGFRIDHVLLSPELADRLVACGVDKDYRGREKASDHAPVWVELQRLTRIAAHCTAGSAPRPRMSAIRQRTSDQR